MLGLRRLLSNSLLVPDKPRSRSSSNGSRSSLGVCNHGEFKILIIGSTGVGKKSICQKYVGHVSDEKEEECHVFDTGIFISVDDETRQYDLEIFPFNADTVHGKDCSEYKREILAVDGYMLVYAKDNKQSFMRLIEIISDIHHFTDGNAPIVIVGNKTDVEQSFQKVTAADILSLPHQHLPHQHFDASAQRNEGIQNAFNCLVHGCIKVRDAKQKD